MSFPVKLYVYDLSHGQAKLLSVRFTGKLIEGIWHTSVVVYGKEYFFGQSIEGVSAYEPGTTQHGTPLRVHDMGSTEITQDIFEDFLADNSTEWAGSTYHLLDHNCNNFADFACEFLVGKHIPESITGLPQEFLNSHLGRMMLPVIEKMFGQSTKAKEAPPPQVSTSSDAMQAGLAALFNTPMAADLVSNIANAAKSADPRTISAATAGVNGLFNQFNQQQQKQKQQQQQQQQQTNVPKLKHNDLKLNSFRAFPTNPIRYDAYSNIETIVKKARELGALEVSQGDKILAVMNSGETAAISDVHSCVESLLERAIALVTSSRADVAFPLVDLVRIMATIKYERIYETNSNLENVRKTVSLLAKLVKVASSTAEKSKDGEKNVATRSGPLWMMILRVTTNLLSTEIGSQLVLSQTDHFEDITFRGLFTAELIEGLLSELATVRQVASGMAFNVALVVAQRRMHANKEGSGSEQEDEGYTSEWECELIAAISGTLDTLAKEQIPPFAKQDAAENYIDSIIRLIVSLTNILNDAAEELVDLAQGVDTAATLDALVARVANDIPKKLASDEPVSSQTLKKYTAVGSLAENLKSLLS